MRRAVSRDLMYPQTMGTMSRSSFMKPVSKSGAAYGSGLVMCVEPREKGYSRKWNMVKKFPGGMSMWSPNQPLMTL